MVFSSKMHKHISAHLKPSYFATVGIAITSSILAATSAQAVQFDFSNITNNSATDAAIGENQLFVDVTDAGGGQALFTFTNTGPEDSSIVQIYFDDENNSIISGIASIDNSSPGVAYSLGSSPPNLPGGNPVNFDSDFSADADSPKQPNGVNPGEFVGLTLDLVGGFDFDDLLAELNSGELVVGIHVQGYASGGSESFINNPGDGHGGNGGNGNGTKVPEPGTMAALGLLACAFAGTRRR